MDKVGRLKKVINNNKVTEYTYNGNGTRRSLKYPGGTTEEYSYYKNNLLKGLKNIKPDGTIIDTYSYEYDKVGNQTKKQDIKGITEYKYDPLNRLSEVKENTELANNRVTTYTYDKAGNRTLETVDGIKNIYKYNEDNRLLNVEKIVGDIKEEEKNYKYDYNGNQLEVQTINYNKNVESSKKSSTEKNVVENSFDLLNRLVATKSANNENVKNIYNGEGKRVGKEVNGNLTTYVYEGDKVILELDKEGKIKARNTQGVNLISREIEKNTAYYLYNGHVDITSLVDESGKELASYYYDVLQ